MSTQFKGITHYGDNLIMTELENNLKNFLDWSILKIGGWTNITIPTSGSYGGTFSDLELVSDPGYTSGQVWEGIRKDWVWETGIDYISRGAITYNPLSVSVEVDGTPITTGTAGYEHHINYPLGRIVFDTEIATTSSVKAQYSFRNVQVYRADDVDWWRQLQYNSLRPDDTNWTNHQGEWRLNADHRIQLPAILIEAVPRSYSFGYELGNAALETYQDILFHVCAENKFDRNNLLDFLKVQQDLTFQIYNSDTISRSGDFPLDERGMVVNNPKMYPELTRTYNWKKVIWHNVVLSEVESFNSRLHIGTVRATLSLIFGDIGV